MDFIKRNISTLLLAIFVIVTTSMIYAPMFAYQEGMQIFMWGADFFADMCLRPGGLSDYVGCFWVQFFMYPAWIAVIFTLVVVGLKIIAKNIFQQQCSEPWADFLSVVCALGLMVAIVNLNTVFGGVVAVLLSVLAVRIKDLTQNIVILSVATPLVYWAAGGWCCILYILGIGLDKKINKSFIFLSVNALVLAFTVLITKKIMHDDSLLDTFAGVDYNLYDKTPNVSWLVSVAIVALCIILTKIDVKINKKIIQIALNAVAVAGLVVWMAHTYDKSSMLDYKIDKMVRFKQWERIVNTMTDRYNKTSQSSNYYTSYQAQCYFNLALSELGILDSKMFNILQIGTEGLASAEINNTDKSICNSEIYFRLGLLNIAERLAVEAMESNDTHQKSARQYKRLAEISIIRQDKPLAMRYIKKLQKTLFYRAWANRAEQYLNNPSNVQPLADWKIKPLTMDNDVFFTPSTGAYFLYNLLVNNPHNVKVFRYFVARLLLEKNISKLYEFLSQYHPDSEMGISIYEATILYLFINNKEEFDKAMSANNELTRRFGAFCNFMSSPAAKDPQKAKELYGKTYWFYYYYCN